jgi:hypothetical protein
MASGWFVRCGRHVAELVRKVVAHHARQSGFTEGESISSPTLSHVTAAGSFVLVHEWPCRREGS